MSLIIIMKQFDQNSFKLIEDYVEALRSKFSQMSALELKKEKIIMVKDLQQINQLLDQVINQQYREVPRTAQDLTRQIDKTKRMKKNLKKSLQNFEFMLTGDYIVKADEEIEKLSNAVKVAKEEVNKFGRMLQIPMQKDIQICDDLQRDVYRIEKDVEEMKIKNHKKREAISQIRDQNQKKIEGIKKVGKEIEKFIQNNDLEENFKNSISKDEVNEYQQIVNKKDRLLNLIQRDQKRYSKTYKSKLKIYQQIDEASRQIQYFLQEIEKSLTVKAQEVEKFIVSSRKQHRKSEPNVATRRKIRTQENSETQNAIKYKSKISSLGKQTNDESITYLPKVNKLPGNSQNSDHLLPRLYRALGKSRLQIEQDCNIRDLIYM